MPSFTSTVLTTLLAAGNLAAAHMEMSYPPPFRSKFNPNAGSNIDYSMTGPLSSDGSNYPCKGYHKDVGTAAGAPTASFAPGGTYNMTIVGGAAHGGGSCQASLSYDGGATFTVIESIIGGCPLSSSYDFTIPSDAPTGQAIFSWSWQNALGNREFYQNCAPITIGGGGSKKRRDAVVKPRASFSSRPSIFLANLGNGCTTVEPSSVKYPDPGPDVKDNGGAQAPPTGSCGSSAPGGGSGGGGGGGAPGGGAPGGTPDNGAPGGGSGSPGGGSGSPGGGSGSPGGGSGSGGDSPAPTSKPPTAPSPPPSKPTTIPAPGSGPKPSGPPGGVFITIPTGAPAAPTGSAPSTMITATRPVGTAPAAKPTAPASPPVGGGGGQSGACTNEGAWNCVDGKSFQRCASGQWSAVIQMAAGTKCTTGMSEVLGMAGRRVRRA